MTRVRVPIALLSLCALAGCAAEPVGILPSRGEPTVGTFNGETRHGSTRRVVADWDDVRAAVDLAISQSQCGFLAWEDDGAGADARRWYKFLTIRDQTGTLEVRRERADQPALSGSAGGRRNPPPPQPETLILTCSVGFAGDAAYEKMILDYLERRLLALVGDGTARIPTPWGINQ